MSLTRWAVCAIVIVGWTAMWWLKMPQFKAGPPEPVFRDGGALWDAILGFATGVFLMALIP